MQRFATMTSCLLACALLAACGGSGQDDAAAPAAETAASRDDAATTAEIETAAEDGGEAEAVPEFPVIPAIVVPDIVGVSAAQRALESSIQDVLDPVAGISVKPARCDAGGQLLADGGLTSVDAQGRWTRNSGQGAFQLAADGSGSANYEGGQIVVNADGSGSINAASGRPSSGDEEDDDDSGTRGPIVEVEADGSGRYSGPAGQIALDGKGGGSWNDEDNRIQNNGDGSGSWNGPLGLVVVNKDGSGTWNGPDGIVRNHGDGTATVGTPGRKVKMAPLAKLAPAGKFPPLAKFSLPGAPCGYVITLSDRVLFDFDKSDIRPDAAEVLDALAKALAKVKSRGLEIRGHTDAKGADDYNQALSERRAQSVVGALRQRGAAADASAKGYGEAQPVAANEVAGQDNPSGRQLNRRVEIFVRT